MNLLFVSDCSITCVIGGAERVLYEQATRLAARGHSVHILTRRLPCHRQERERIDGVDEWRYAVDDSGAASFLWRTWQNSRIMFERIQETAPPDAINFHQPFSALGVVRSPRARWARKIYTCHSLSFEEYVSRNPQPRTLRQQLRHRLHVDGRRFIEKSILDRSDIVVALSAFTEDKLVRSHRVPREKITLVPGGVDLKRFFPCRERDAIRARLGIPGQRVVLLTVRNLVSRMGLENLVTAMHQVVVNAPDVLLVIGGQGPLRAGLEALSRDLGVENHVHMAGFIPEEDLADYYRMADVFVLPTVELEGFGLVTLEAMASGTPVLGTPIGATPEIIRPFRPDFVFRDTRPETMATQVLKTVGEVRESPGSWQEVRDQCRRYVTSRYSWSGNIDALERLLRS